MDRVTESGRPVWNGGVVDTQQVLELMKSVAAEVITPRFRSLADGEVMEKNPGDLVTIADQESEAILTRELSAAFPGAFILGEELTSIDPTTLDRYVAAEHAFTVDPVDGTKNFVHGSPDHAVMVSEVLRGETVRAWIWQPEHEVAWVAEKGGGVYRNGERIVREPVADGVASARRHVDLAAAGSLAGFAAGAGRVVGLLRCRLPPADGGRGRLHPLRAQQPVGPLPRHADGHRGRWLRGHTDGTPYAPTVLTPGIIVAADRGTYAAVRRHAAEAFAKRAEPDAPTLVRMTSRTWDHTEVCRVVGLDGDLAALGGAVTTALCGHWEHDGPCRWPHFTSPEVDDDAVVVTVYFDAPAARGAAGPRAHPVRPGHRLTGRSRRHHDHLAPPIPQAADLPRTGPVHIRGGGTASSPYAVHEEPLRVSSASQVQGHRGGRPRRLRLSGW